MRSNFIDNRPLREAFERSELTAKQLAHQLGYTRVFRAQVTGDDSPVRRALGLKPSCNGNTQRYMLEATALRYARVLNLDPVDIGL